MAKRTRSSEAQRLEEENRKLRQELERARAQLAQAVPSPSTREANELLRAALDRYPGAVILYNAERRIEFANVQAISASGNSEADLIGHTDEEVFPDQVTREYLPLLRRATETRTAQSGEFA